MVKIFQTLHHDRSVEHCSESIIWWASPINVIVCLPSCVKSWRNVTKSSCITMEFLDGQEKTFSIFLLDDFKIQANKSILHHDSYCSRCQLHGYYRIVYIEEVLLQHAWIWHRLNIMDINRQQWRQIETDIVTGIPESRLHLDTH